MVNERIMISKIFLSDITNFKAILNHILGIVFIIIVFSLAYGYLKPHLLHKRRLVSTLLLKGSYLLYLLILLVVIYLSALVADGGMQKVFEGVEFFAFLVVLFVPTIGIFARKLGQFSKKREGYNYFFTVVNFIAIVSILLMYFI
jgi:hypothetical protein